MAKTKEQKKEIVTRLEDAFKNATSTVFVHFSKVNVSEESAMRRSLRAEGVKYLVAKKTLIKRALESLGHQSTEVPLEGEIAVAYGGEGDATAPPRLIHELGKKLRDSSTALGASKLSILGGIFEGKLVGQATMQEISTIPPFETLRAMFAQVINSPQQRFAVVLGKVAEKK